MSTARERRRRRRSWMMTGAPFDPVAESAGAITGWLRFALGTSDVNGFSSIPDVVNPGHPATQADDDRKPERVLSANGLPLAEFDGTDVLIWPFSAGNSNLVINGFNCWFIPAATPGQAELYYIAVAPGGASAAVVQPLISGSNFDVYVYTSGSAARRARVAGMFSVGVPVNVGWEFNGNGATEADRCVITKNGVAQVVTFSDGFGGAASMPASLRAAVGNIDIGGGGDSDTPATPFTGRLGPNLYSFGAAMPGVTSGLLTPAFRLALANSEAPTV